MKLENMSSKENEFTKQIDKIINELVYEKTQLVKAYNYYHGKRDPEQFRHLEENYGIGTPTSVEFVPIVRKHINVLIGEYLSTPLMPKVSCKDKETLSSIHRQKQLTINNEVAKLINEQIMSITDNAIKGVAYTADKQLEAMLNDVADNIDRNYISDFEIAAQNIVDWSMQSKHIDFLQKRETILTDLLVGGICYYRSLPSPAKENVEITILNPLNTFIDRNPNSRYANKSPRAVIRDYLTKDQILAKFGEWLTKDHIQDLENMDAYSIDASNVTYLRSFDSVVSGDTVSDGILGGFEVTPLLPFERNTSRYFRLYPVYDVEWLATEQENGKFITNRYRGVRISNNIYLTFGKVEDVSRSVEDPSDCSLSINGLFYSDRNGDPFSLILATANLQDKYDILNFYRDNLIAESGSVGDWLDIAYLPAILGTDLTEKIMKWKAYKKQGVALFDSSQEGNPPSNTTFGGFDDTIKAQTIQGIDLAMQRIEETCSSITGVSREKLGGIEQKDAVNNVKVGIIQSSYTTKQYYQVMDLITREILLDILNITKVVFKKGFTGTLILGERLNKIFTALPEHYTVSDHDIHITDSSEIIKELETIKQLTFEFVKSGTVDPEIILEVITSKGLTKMKSDVNAAMLKKRAETNQLNQLNQKVEELEAQLKQAVSEKEKLQGDVTRLNHEKLQLEAERLAFDKELGWYEAKNEAMFNEAKIDWERKRVELEAAQLLDSNPKNDEIKNN